MSDLAAQLPTPDRRVQAAHCWGSVLGHLVDMSSDCPTHVNLAARHVSRLDRVHLSWAGLDLAGLRPWLETNNAQLGWA